MTAWLTKQSTPRTANEPDGIRHRTDSSQNYEEREMLLSPCFALNTTTTKELWIEQALEAYPCASLKKEIVKVTPKHCAVRKLRELQGFSLFGYLQSIIGAQTAQALQA
jgi:hypothetical protein